MARRRSRLIAAFSAVLLGGVVATAGAAGAVSHAAKVTYDDVIVQAAQGDVAGARHAVTAAGGRAGTALPIVDGFEAKVPAGTEGALGASAAIRAVTPNQKVHFDSTSYDASRTNSAFVRTTQASSQWGVGHYGQGVGVAVLDTGVSPMADLASHVIYGPDLSGEGRVIDTYGHGTVMAGLIAGDGTASNNGHPYLGVAPGANIVAVKAAGADGSTDVSILLQGLHWVSAYAQQYNIRVVNLSWGLDSAQSPLLDPVDYAVERLWKQGIVVVVSAGNHGPDAGTIATPGSDPVVLTVGAYDDHGTTATADDNVTQWSARGPTQWGVQKPDLVAPGRTVIATRSFGSTIEQENPHALIGSSYIKGSGTSEAAAITSGAVALLLQQRPSLTPDQVKSLLTGTAVPISGTASSAQGSGRISLANAAFALAGLPHSQLPLATGLGSLELSRGSSHVAMACPGSTTAVPVVGEVDVRCEAWDPIAWTGAAWNGAAWNGAAWNGAAWNGAAWNGAAWNGGTWSGGSWQGSAWTGAAWNGSAWNGAAWNGAAWNGTEWASGTWAGAAWNGAAWNGAAWNGAAWNSSNWDGETWASAFYGDAPPDWDPLPGEAVLPHDLSVTLWQLHQSVFSALNPLNGLLGG